jgi:hydroxymethylpyrimidine/phosphomethylpyrimidine kinase
MNRVLVIGGSDSSCGAGISADIETLLDLGSDFLICVTAVTAQKDSSFKESLSVDASMIKAQLDSAYGNKIDAVKIGMLPNIEAIEMVTEFLEKIPSSKIVLDPVFKSSSGGILCSIESIQLLKKILLPHVTVLTPNLDEANILASLEIYDSENVSDLAEACIKYGSESVLIKGGHSTDVSCKDFLLNSNNKKFTFERERISKGTDVRGTGCRLATSIAHFLALGNSNLERAVLNAGDYLHQYIIKKVSESNDS